MSDGMVVELTLSLEEKVNNSEFPSSVLKNSCHPQHVHTCLGMLHQ